MRKLSLKSPELLKTYCGSGKISARFRNINVTLFIIFTTLISVVMLFALQNITDTVSKDYARLYSANTAGILNTYFKGELALVSKAAHSNAVIDWFGDEDNYEKKLAAYKEMKEITGELISGNLYIGIEKTLHEFTFDKNHMIDDITPFSTFDPNNFDDAWYFECAASDKEYLLRVDIDKILHRKLVWLNYKVTYNGTVLGALCTGMEISGFIEKLFAEYDYKNVRSLVIDENGVIHMDSTFLGDAGFLRYTSEDEYRIEDEISEPAFLTAFNEYLDDIDGYFNLESDTTIIEMKNGKYHYATASPIASTTWSVVTLYKASSLFGIANLFPLLIIIFFMFLLFIIVTGYMSTKLIFTPFGKLMQSIARIKTNRYENVYGTERHDEIGDLANTIQDMKDNLIDALEKVHYDALTGIYNRRFLEENFNRIIHSLSRSGGVLSVMMLDVDFFKKYNDTYGHSMGDSCLRYVATAIMNSMSRADDFVARYGGEEFVVVLSNTDENGARIVANKILENVRMLCLPHEKSDVADYVTISIGVTTGNTEYVQNGDVYIKRADEALYISKKTGRNKYTFVNIGRE